ncbi:CubicO group peptidase, beta-lactamase class C family [Spirosomataceae bacterium TFI 002]|nr:CubicO group peptidase, beta-lactamase class C family [Spirosomataceae bacterium TFI 002]
MSIKPFEAFGIKRRTSIIDSVMKKMLFTVLTISLFSCGKKDIPKSDQTELYFPTSQNWETISPSSLKWDTQKIEELYDVLEAGKSRAFLVLKDGKIVLEKYWGKDILNFRDFDQDAQWYWASAGKTLTASLVGIAEQEGYLSQKDKTSQYLGINWTSLPLEKEEKITIGNQLTMTSGLDDLVPNSGSIAPQDLKYKADAGTRWAYHNAPYTLLDQVVSKATNTDFDIYFENKIKSKTGMDGQWRWINNDHVYFSTARSMARFGLLILNKGQWENEIVVNESFISEMTASSQDLNQSYGYLWWLNGKPSYKLPTIQTNFNGSIIPNGPSDMVMGLGKNGQFICVIPSQNIVLIRMGEDPDPSPVTTLFLDQIWKKMNEITP